MGRSGLSNRQRKQARKAAPKAGRRVRSPAQGPSIAAAEPRGTAAREAVRDQVAERQVRQHLDIVVALAIGNISAAEAKAEFEVEPYAGADMVRHVRRGDREGGSGLRVRDLDGLVALHKSKALTDAQFEAGRAYRVCYQQVEKALGSCLGRVGEGRGTRDWSQLAIATDAEGELVLLTSAADLHRAYVTMRLNQIERAVFGLPDPRGVVWLANPDGRELAALRRIAGDGQSLRDVAGASGHAREATKNALSRALDATARLLRITGQ